MYRRLFILSVIILGAMCGLVWLGYHSLRMWGEGMEASRLGEFAKVAELIRKDVKEKLDDFMAAEEERPYTDYQYYHVPDNAEQVEQQLLLVRSPLGGSLVNGFAYGNFQIDAGGTITNPHYDLRQAATAANNELYVAAINNTTNIKANLLPVLGTGASGLLSADVDRMQKTLAQAAFRKQQEVKGVKSGDVAGKQVRLSAGKQRNFPIGSFQNEDQRVQVVFQRRAILESNIRANAASVWGGGLMPGRSMESTAKRQQVPAEQQRYMEVTGADTAEEVGREAGQADLLPANGGQRPAGGSGDVVTGPEDARRVVSEASQAARSLDHAETAPPQAQAAQQADTKLAERQAQMADQAPISGPASRSDEEGRESADEYQSETVQIRVEPFVPIVVPGGDEPGSIFAGQVFMLRRVQIEETYLLQGFQLNERELVDEIRESAHRCMSRGMDFELASQENQASAYTAVLDFGFGDLVLNLLETDPGRIGRMISEQRTWYLSIVAVVLLAVTLGLASLWRNARAQIKLAQKKDDFISAVSHELRTPLTSIRMYSEMLEKSWVRSEDKRAEYYRNMRQESERLSRLIENVLDFSRIQRGRKKYVFSVGDINRCVADVVGMMSPYASQNGFSIRTELGEVRPTSFDADAVTQIVVNLLDNAIKYARNAEDKTITVRTRGEQRLTVIEVEDHGPGVPHRQRERIFEEFYRVGSEATRETTGTGLGLALVKRFARAHNGFVDILGARPTGAIFRVCLALKG
ncbi:MAG: HAMP domain-containing histidine kinase [Phycisphaerales bacterium]|nr:MAG: HAMP domain-containing histidine kinase [Phycisphaerales bacterium]